MDTIFGKIIRREIPADIIYENEQVLAFRDINPQAPTHILIIPKKTIPTLADATGADELLLGKLLSAAKEIAAQAGIAEQGYRVVINSGAGAGQTVFHLHLHLMSGRPFAWPPG